MLGTPLGHPDFVRTHLIELAEEQWISVRKDSKGERRARGLALVGALCVRPSQFFLTVSQTRGSGRIRPGA